MPPPASTSIGTSGAGLGFSVGAYVMWGAMPLYFSLLVPAGSVEIVALRILLSLVFCALLITAMRAWPALVAIVRHPRTVGILALAGGLIAINWIVYVFAATTGQVVAASLGYFINPIFTVLLGVIVLRERLRVLQWVAIGISGVAVVVLAIGYGEVPWISLLLAGSFGLYGLVKKRVGGRVDAVSGLAIETAALAPLAIVALFVVNATGGIVTGTIGTAHTLLVLSAGIVTAVPLLLFAASARRLSLTAMGLTQYLTPILQLLVGVGIMHEVMPVERWIGFGIVWLALLVLTIDMLGHNGRQRAAAPVPGAA